MCLQMIMYVIDQNVRGIKEVQYCDSVVVDLTIAEQRTIHTFLHPSTQLILDLLKSVLICVPIVCQAVHSIPSHTSPNLISQPVCERRPLCVHLTEAET